MGDQVNNVGLLFVAMNESCQHLLIMVSHVGDLLDYGLLAGILRYFRGQLCEHFRVDGVAARRVGLAVGMLQLAHIDHTDVHRRRLVNHLVDDLFKHGVKLSFISLGSTEVIIAILV